MEGLNKNSNSQEVFNFKESEEYTFLKESLEKVSISLAKAVYKTEVLTNEERKNIGRIMVFIQTLDNNISIDELESIKDRVNEVSNEIISEDQKYAITTSINNLLVLLIKKAA